jgi:cell division protein FtsN
MSQAPQGPGKKTPEATQARRQLWVRALVACGLIGVLLGGLAVFDRISRPQDPPDADIPTRPIAPARVQEPPKETTPEAIPGSSEVKVPPAEVAQNQKDAEGKAPAEAGPGAPAAKGEASATQPAPASAVSSGTIRKPPQARERVVAEPEGTAPIPIARSEAATPRGEVAEETRPVGRKGPRTDPEAEAPRSSGASSVLTRGFGVHMGIFADMLRAEELRERLARAGIPARVEVRVVVGPYAERREAQQAQEQLKARGFTPGSVVPFNH